MKILGLVAIAALAVAGTALADGSATTKTTVNVTAREYTLRVTPASVPRGTVRFRVRNAGRVAHALSVRGPGLATVTTPLIQPGATRSITVTLGGGTFRLWCPVGTHAAAGMKATLKVRGIVSPPATTTNPGYGGGDGYY